MKIVIADDGAWEEFATTAVGQAALSHGDCCRLRPLGPTLGFGPFDIVLVITGEPDDERGANLYRAWFGMVKAKLAERGLVVYQAVVS